MTLGLILVRPRGLSEASGAMIGAALMLLLGLETWRQAWSTIAQGGDVLLFLLALMLLSALLEMSGFFEWAAIVAAHQAKGDAHILYRNVFILGALTTAFLSLDTTAIIFTPIVLTFVARLNLPAKPYLLACACVANTASLLLPISNLTNLLYFSRYHFGFAAFTLRMLIPQLAAVAVNYLLLRWVLFRKQLGGSFDLKSLPHSREVLPDPLFFRAALVVLGLILIGYFTGSLVNTPPYLVALAGCSALLAVGVWRRRVEWRSLNQGISWPLFAFVIGLFVVVRGVENIGLAPFASKGLEHAGHSVIALILVTAFGAGIGSNIVNNIPAALLALSVLANAHAPAAAVYGSLLGCNIGPNLTVVGSLATMLVLTSARQRGVDMKGSEFFKAGLVITPLTLLAACLALWPLIR